ncbi:hypothetical protein [Winogradskyella sp. 3972H.M.0a.05]|uniref:hypothetical protein n=1 Tax=Winogradskyella sp. 3972H.M.0a.05 TaxID=2950277 RepID=UPI0033964181
MKIRWSHISFIILLFVLGAIHQQQVVVPNQEIVLQFNDDEVSNEEAQQTILKVQEQLTALGADNISVVRGDDGNLKISYYSNSEVIAVKEALSDNSLLANTSDDNNGHSEIPLSSSDDQISYNLDVYEIHQSTNLDGFNGKLFLESQPENDRSTSTSLSGISNTNGYRLKFFDEATTLKTQETIVLAIDNKLYQIPEVRAGPSHIGA